MKKSQINLEDINKVLKIINKIDNIDYINPDLEEIKKEVTILEKDIDKKYKNHLDTKK